MTEAAWCSSSFIPASNHLSTQVHWAKTLVMIHSMHDVVLLLPFAGQDENGLWYNSRWSEQQWLDAWAIVAKRYANTSAVVGAGLRNEPRPARLQGEPAARPGPATAAQSLTAQRLAHPRT